MEACGMMVAVQEGLEGVSEGPEGSGVAGKCPELPE